MTRYSVLFALLIQTLFLRNSTGMTVTPNPSPSVSNSRVVAFRGVDVVVAGLSFIPVSIYAKYLNNRKKRCLEKAWQEQSLTLKGLGSKLQMGAQLQLFEAEPEELFNCLWQHQEEFGNDDKKLLQDIRAKMFGLDAELAIELPLVDGVLLGTIYSLLFDFGSGKPIFSPIVLNTVRALIKWHISINKKEIEYGVGITTATPSSSMRAIPLDTEP